MMQELLTGRFGISAMKDSHILRRVLMWAQGGRVVKMIVAILYGKGVIYCEQYDKLDGNLVADFVRRNFPKMFRKRAENVARSCLCKIIVLF